MVRATSTDLIRLWAISSTTYRISRDTMLWYAAYSEGGNSPASSITAVDRHSRYSRMAKLTERPADLLARVIRKEQPDRIGLWDRVAERPPVLRSSSG